MKATVLLQRVRRFAPATAVLIGITLLVLWLSGVFHTVTPATEQPAQVAPKLPAGVTTTPVAATAVPVREEAVGTIQAVQEVKISSRVLARIVQMHVTKAGQQVAAGQVLVELEDTDLKARLNEAEAARRASQEQRDQAQRDLQRTKDLHGQKIASDSDLERDTTRQQSAEAELERATQNVAAARAALDYATIRAPIAGTVIDKLAENGDTASPGQVLMTLYDPHRMQLVASVREQLATQLKVGGDVAVRIDALDLDCRGTVAEIVPLAGGARTFDVKVTGPCPEGVFTGMFGRLFVATGTRQEVRVPRSAVRTFGQIDQVTVVREDGSLLRRFVVLGREHGDQVTVESGLQDGETIVKDASQLAAAGGR